MIHISQVISEVLGCSFKSQSFDSGFAFMLCNCFAYQASCFELNILGLVMQALELMLEIRF